METINKHPFLTGFAASWAVNSIALVWWLVFGGLAMVGAATSSYNVEKTFNEGMLVANCCPAVLNLVGIIFSLTRGRRFVGGWVAGMLLNVVIAVCLIGGFYAFTALAPLIYR